MIGVCPLRITNLDLDHVAVSSSLRSLDWDTNIGHCNTYVCATHFTFSHLLFRFVVNVTEKTECSYAMDVTMGEFRIFNYDKRHQGKVRQSFHEAGGPQLPDVSLF